MEHRRGDADPLPSVDRLPVADEAQGADHDDRRHADSKPEQIPEGDVMMRFHTAIKAATVEP